MAGPAIDYDALLARTLSHRVLADELLAAFRDDAPAVLAAVRSAAAAGDADAVRRGLHRLKGSARTVSADALADSVAAAEARIAAGESFLIDGIAGELERCLAAIRPESAAP